jgi:hypothetical protein
MKLPVTVSRAFRFAVLAAVLAGLAVTPAAADNGQPILAGEANTATTPTVVSNTAGNLYGLDVSGADIGIIGEGRRPQGGIGVEGDGLTGVDGQSNLLGGTGVVGASTAAQGTGVEGDGLTGVDGQSNLLGGTGVMGASTAAQGIGVEGESDGSGSGVYGLANATGVGVFGDTTNATGVLARSTTGKALDVRGKATFSRSGQVTIAAGTTSKKITLTGVTTASMILATAQQDSTVYIRSAVPASGSFTIHLTGQAPTGGLKVAYFVLN